MKDIQKLVDTAKEEESQIVENALICTTPELVSLLESGAKPEYLNQPIVEGHPELRGVVSLISFQNFYFKGATGSIQPELEKYLLEN